MHRRRRETMRSPATPIPPEGLGRDGPISLLLLLADACIASSSRLDLGSVALPTNVTVFIEREYLGGKKDRFLDFILGVRNHGRSC